MENPIKQIIKFNSDAGLLDGYDYFLESSMLIEEALEGFDLGVLKPKDVARQICSPLDFTGSEVDSLDKSCDAAIIAVGGIAKHGLTYSQVVRALNVVMQANFAKLGMPRDEHGKLQKPDNFVGPEAALQQILDER